MAFNHNLLKLLDSLIQSFQNDHFDDIKQDNIKQDHFDEKIDAISNNDDYEFIEFQQNCILLKNIITIDEQFDLYKAVIKGSSYTKQPKGKVNANKNFTNIMKIIPTHKHHQCRLSPIYSKLFDRAYDKINNKLSSKIKTKLPLKSTIYKHRMKGYQYIAPNGNIHRHIDNRPGFVALYSIGCTVNFYVNGPKMKIKNGIQFKFESGDILIFSATKRDGINHGVDNVIDGSCPQQLLDKDPVLCEKLNHVRISIQTRFRDKKYMDKE